MESRKLKLEGVKVDASIPLEKVAVIAVSTGTLTAPSAGYVCTTIGGILSGSNPVSNVQVYVAAKLLPARSDTAVVTRPMYVVCGRSAAAGSSSMRLPNTERVEVTGTPPAGVSVNEEEVTEALSIASLNVTTTRGSRPTPTAPSLGEVELMVGGVLSPPPVGPSPPQARGIVIRAVIKRPASDDCIRLMIGISGWGRVCLLFYYTSATRQLQLERKDRSRVID